MKKEKASIGNYFKLPNPGLRAYFEHTASGQPDDYRPPLFKGRSRDSVLELWQKELDSLGLEEKFPDLNVFEQDMKSKVGPMSIQLPLKDRIESIENYYTCIEEPSVPISNEALGRTVDFFKKAGGISLATRGKVIENMRLSTNSGCPYFTKRRNVVEETLKYSYYTNDMKPTGIQMMSDDYREDNDPEMDDYLSCAVLGWRGQEGGIHEEDVKQRVVWMMPFLLNIEELQFYQPAIKAVQKYGLIPAYVSMDAVDQEVTRLFDTKNPHDLVICTDFTKFDQHFNKDMQDAAHYVISHLMTTRKGRPMGREAYWLRQTFWYKYNIPLMCSEDLIFTGPHGMGSGSGGTNFDECMAHKALQFEAAVENGQALNPHSMAYGDDGILSYPGITVEQVTQAYTKHGQEMNETKQYASEHDCVVLRRWHGTNYRVNGTMVGVYSTFRALGRLLAQERYYDPEKWSKEMVILRSLSILENCKWHPYFHQFVDFVMEKGDKYRLGLSIPGFFEKLTKLAKDAIENFQDFLGYTKTMQDGDDAVNGISDWEVVKYIKSKMS